MREKRGEHRDSRVNFVFSIIAFTWLINTALFSYLPSHSQEVPKFLNLVTPFSFLYWAISGFPYIFIGLVVGMKGPAMVVPLIATAAYWWAMSIWIVGSSDRRKNVDSHTAKQAAKIAKGMAPTPMTKAAGVGMSIVLFLLLVWLLERTF